MEEVLKALNISPNVLARRSNAMWDILLATEKEVKQLAGSIRMMKNVRLQTMYMATRRKKLRCMWCPWISGMDSFFSKYGLVEEVNAIISKFGITTGDMVLQVTLTQQAFG